MRRGFLNVRPRDARDRLIVALDLPSVTQAETLVGELGETVSFYKIGMQLVFAGGLPLIEDLVAEGKRIFLDMKLLDIDNTVAGGVTSIDQLGVTLTTIHAYPKAMQAAVNADPDRRTGLLAVTVLTSMDDQDLLQAGYREPAEKLVARRAEEALKAGMDGIVCSPVEASRVREIVGPDMLIVTPGIRPAGSSVGDQKRVMGPAEAIGAGADYLVVGRPVSAATDPVGAASRIIDEIKNTIGD